MSHSSKSLNLVILILLFLTVGYGAFQAKDQFGTRRIYVNNGSALIAGDFTLGAGWGTTASASVTGNDSNFAIFVTSSGTGQSAFTTSVKLTYHDGYWGTIPRIVCNGWGNTGLNLNAIAFSTTGSFTPTTGTFYMGLLPVASQIYTTNCYTIAGAP